jgi:stage II sporulation protein D
LHKSLIIGILGAAACASALPRGGSESVIDDNDQPVRIALSTSDESAKVGATGAWRIYNRNSADLVTKGSSDATMRIEPRGGQMVIIKSDGSTTSRRSGPLLVRATTPGSFVMYEGKRYRGELVVTVNQGALLVVNRLGVESYLRGVVPLEIGDRKAGEEAAVEAQAVAARSYTYIHMSEAGDRAFDMYGSIQDQAYGGVDAEKPMPDAAVASTRDMVIKYAGRIISTPYHSTCGGRTASTSEVWWRQTDQPYLRPVSDQIPGTNSYYCDPSPRFKWTATFNQDQLRASLEKYLFYSNRGVRATGKSSGEHATNDTRTNHRFENRRTHCVGSRKGCFDSDRERQLRGKRKRCAVRAASAERRSSQQHIFHRRNDV